MNQSGISGWMVTFISKTCQDPAEAIQTFTYLISDYGQILTTYGIEGETYTIDADGKYVLNDDIKELQSSDNDRYKKEIRLGKFCIFGHDRYKALSPDAYPEAIHQFQEWGLGKLKGHFILESTSPDNGTSEARANDAITTEWATTLGALILSGSDAEFDQILANYKQFLADNDYEAVLLRRCRRRTAGPRLSRAYLPGGPRLWRCLYRGRCLHLLPDEQGSAGAACGALFWRKRKPVQFLPDPYPKLRLCPWKLCLCGR